MRRHLKILLVLLLAIVSFVPYIDVNADDDSTVTIVVSQEYTGNGTITVSGGAYDGSISYDHTISDAFAKNQPITLTATPANRSTFKGWYECEQYEIVPGLNGWRPVDEDTPLSTNVTYVFTPTQDTHNIMPKFITGHNNIWTTTGGTVAVLYENSLTPEQDDGEHYGSGSVVSFVIGDEITVKAKQNDGYRFVGWYVSDVEKGPQYYYRNKLVSNTYNYKYKPMVTTVQGIDEPINYITAVFKKRVTYVDTFNVLTTITDVVPFDTNISSYINSQIYDLTSNDTDEGVSLNNRWHALFGEVDGVNQYPRKTGQTWTFVSQEVTDTEIINHYTVGYDRAIVQPENTSRVQIILNNQGGTYNISYGENNLDKTSTYSFFVGEGTQITLTATKANGYAFAGWYEAEEYDTDGQGHMAWRATNNRLTSNTTYTFDAPSPFINVMPQFVEVNGSVVHSYDLELSEQATANDEIAYDADVSSYINDKKAEFTATLDSFINGKLNVAVPNYDGLFTNNSYAVISSIDYIGADYQYSNDAILIGTVEDIDNAIVVQGTIDHIQHYAIKYTKYNVTQADPPRPAQEVYTVPSADGNATVIFTFDEGHTFVLTFRDILTMTAQEVQEAYGVPVEDFNAAKTLMLNNLKSYGDVIAVYDITVDDGPMGYSDALKLRIKLNDLMKQYKKLKLIYMDENNNFVVSEVKNLTIKDDVAEGDLNHLSVYALVGSNEEDPAPANDSPSTGDKILLYLSLLLIGVYGLGETLILTKKYE